MLPWRSWLIPRREVRQLSRASYSIGLLLGADVVPPFKIAVPRD
jgi:hypothetical protein